MDHPYNPPVERPSHGRGDCCCVSYRCSGQEKPRRVQRNVNTTQLEFFLIHTNNVY